MRVVCISHTCYDWSDTPFGPDDPQIGDECEVICECIGYSTNGTEGPCYELEGYDEWVYDVRNFSPLSDLDETALVTEEFEEKYYQPA